MRGYDYYNFSSSCTIKLKTFLNKNPQWSDIKEWGNFVKRKKERCKYDSHNSDERRVSIKRPDGKHYMVDFPFNEKNNSNVLRWVKPIEDVLTTMYYRKKKIDKIKNIKRNLSVWVDGITYMYDYKDGKVIIFDIRNYNGSIYKTLSNLLININDTIPNLTKEKIKKEIITRDFEVENIIFGKYKTIKSNIKIKV